MADYEQIKLVVETPQFKLNREHYDRVIAAKDDRKLVYEAVLEPNNGDAYYLEPGWVIRLEQRHDTVQINDWLFYTPDLKEHGSYANSFLVEGSYLREYSRIWSSQNPDNQNGGMRAMATMVADEAPEDFGPGRANGYNPHWWYYHCSPEWHYAGVPEEGVGVNACHINFFQAALRLPAVAAIVDPELRRDVANTIASTPNFQTFQPMKYMHDEEGQHRWDLRPCTPVPYGSGVEFYSEITQYALITECPHGDQTAPVGKVPLHPTYISVWDTGIKPLDPPQWGDWRGFLEGQIARGEKDASPRTPDSYID